MHTDVQTALANLGLALREIEVYLNLVEKGRSTVVKISRVTAIPRASVYRTCTELVDKGFIKMLIRQNTTLYEAIEPSQLGFMVRDEEARVEKMKSALTDLQQMINVKFDHVPTTQVRYYEGVSGVKQILWNCLKAETEIVGYSEFGRLDLVGTSFYDKYVKEFRLRGLSDRAIGNEEGLNYMRKHVLSEGNQHQLGSSQIRIIPKEKFYVSGDTSIYNDIYAICYWNRGEVVGVEIENKELVQLHRSVFEILWGVADDLEKYV